MWVSGGKSYWEFAPVRGESGPIRNDQQQVVDVDHAVIGQVGRAGDRRRCAWAPCGDYPKQVVDIDASIVIDIAGQREAADGAALEMGGEIQEIADDDLTADGPHVAQVRSVYDADRWADHGVELFDLLPRLAIPPDNSRAASLDVFAC